MANIDYNPNAPENTYAGYLSTGSQSVKPASATGSSTTSINSTTIAPQAPITVPPPPTPTNGTSANTSIPTPQSIIDQANAPTQADTQQSSLLNQIAQITGGQKSLATQQVEQGNIRNLPQFASTVRSLSSQLQGYNDSLSKLQLDASAGGTIENQLQNEAAGRGITRGGLAPVQTAALRNNQIQQASIASQALTTKAALYAAQNDYTNAKDAADKAAQVLFDADTQKINGLTAQLAAIAPTLTKEQTARAAVLTAQLNERQKQIDNQREDFKTGQAMAIAAMKLNPSDPAAQYAGQQALKLDSKDPQYLEKVSALVGKYQQDPNKAAQDLADLAYKRSQTALNYVQLAKTQAEVDAATGKGGVTKQTYNDRVDTINLVNNILDNKYLSFAVGGQRLNPLNLIPGNAAQPVKAQLDQLIAKLSLDNRSKLKGSGAISDFESKTLEKSASSFNTSLSQDDAVEALKQIRGVLTTLNGGSALIQVKDPKTGETANTTANTEAITKMVNDGLIIKYQ